MKFQFILKWFILLFFILTIIGCNARLESGTIYEMEFRPSYVVTYIYMMPVYNGQTTTFIPVPMMQTYPDRWVIKIKQFNYSKGKDIKETYFVTEEIYNSYKIGDYFNYDSTIATVREPVFEERLKGD
jgi:hypothetical protein